MTERLKRTLITLEGIDGCGKDTQMLMLKEALEKEGYRVAVTNDPGYVGLAAIVRNIVTNAVGQPSPFVQALLMMSSRRNSLEKEIIPAFDNHDIVICTRGEWSTMVYQLPEMDVDESTLLHCVVCDSFTRILSKVGVTSRPFLLDISAEVSNTRTVQRGNLDALETATFDVKQTRVDRYRSLSVNCSTHPIPENMVLTTVDANQSAEQVLKSLLQELLP